MMIYFKQIDRFIEQALLEDMPNGDVTSEAVIPDGHTTTAQLIAKADGVLCGLDLFSRVFEHLGLVQIRKFKRDGMQIQRGDVLAELEGDTKTILAGERTALNILQRMSGIATRTRMAVDQVAHTQCKIVDTRKTTPGFRMFEKMAVRCGGGSNHRFNLSDGILIKDNHIAAAGSLTEAVLRAKRNAPFVYKVEVEVESLEMVEEALEAEADVILLDNMSLDNMRAAVQRIGNRALVEASGNMTLDHIVRVAETGVDRISMGSIIYDGGVLDVSLRFKKFRGDASEQQEAIQESREYGFFTSQEKRSGL